MAEASSFTLTREEHEARAMLMGRDYIPESHTYGSGHSFGTEIFCRFDADTLEPCGVSYIIEQRMRRVQEGHLGCRASS